MHRLPAPTTALGPETTFTGTVLVDMLRGAMDGSRLAMAHVRFTPGARTHWHSHPVGQTLHGTDGLGVVVTRDGTVTTIAPGQTVWTPPGEEHWHGACADRLLAHLAIQEADDAGQQVTWLEPVDDAEYVRAQAAVGDAPTD